MAIHVRHPILISVAQPGIWTFSLLFLLESVGRAALVTVLPLTAFALLRDKQTVSLLYTLVSVAALGISFAIPFLVERISRRWTYTLGCALLASFAALLALDAPAPLVLAMLVRAVGQATLNITLSLYIMDNIGKRELIRSEPLRLATATLAWSAMPPAGVWLMQRAGLWAPCLLSFAAFALLAAVFWWLRLSERGPIRATRPGATIPGHQPLRAIRRFVEQPRLRLAWAIAFGRSAFWVTFFVYVPILMVEGGLGAAAGGLAVGAGNLMLLNNVFMRSFAARFSLRRVLGAALVAAGALTALAAALSSARPATAGAAMVAAAFFVAILDGLGPVPFLRAVHVHERARMTTVYRTYIDASEILPQATYFALFPLFGFPGAFGALALALALIGALTLRHLPRGM
jgi:MFS family permease